MPKKRRRQRVALGGSRKRPGLPQALVGVPGEEGDSDGLDVDDMLGEDEEVMDSHALFLTKIKP